MFSFVTVSSFLFSLGVCDSSSFSLSSLLISSLLSVFLSEDSSTVLDHEQLLLRGDLGIDHELLRDLFLGETVRDFARVTRTSLRRSLLEGLLYLLLLLRLERERDLERERSRFLFEPFLERERLRVRDRPRLRERDFVRDLVLKLSVIKKLFNVQMK